MTLGRQENTAEPAETAVGKSERYKLSVVNQMPLELTHSTGTTTHFEYPVCINCRSQWPRRLRRRSAAARLLRSWVRIPPGALMFACCESCVLSGRGLCDGMITRPEEFYRLWCVVLCDLETSRMRRPWPALGRSATGKQNPLEWQLVSFVRSDAYTGC